MCAICCTHLSREKRHAAAVDPGIVGSCRHSLQVVLPLLTVDVRAGQLPVVHLNLVSLHRLLHGNQRVGGDLVTEPATAAVQHDADLALLLDSHLRRVELVVDLVDHLYFGVVVSSAQRAQLKPINHR